ncbi:conserved hypothetical protein [Shewanella sp. MR-4]|uniref:hypothetical protein n=1 Tax=Shewanella sp. (strain MR-4) TaxID=60480 RepID=UPI00005E5E42|nr:hypothetical protein [Shewanella sp. MR-4]ABI37557.1 conserved hypothetical protein [Shewanella sp. MR-4]
MLKIQLRRQVKYRIAFLVLMIAVYTLGFHLLPEQLTNTREALSLAVVTALYFVLLPVLYWYWIIKIGAQKPWKMLVVLSLSSLMARLSYPHEVAEYFEFIAWLRYPIIAVLLIIELYLIVSIIKGLWQARKASGDPRLAIVEQYAAMAQSEPSAETIKRESINPKKPSESDLPPIPDEKRLTLGLILATEPASWYYAIPYFSRRHPEAIGSLNLLSAKPWHALVVIVGLMAASAVSYSLLDGISHIAALFVSGLLLYSILLMAANYRISRYYSLYQRADKLIINNGMWGFMAVDFTQISELKLGRFSSPVSQASQGDTMPSDAPEILTLGRGEANAQLIFNQPQVYYGAMGQLPESLTVVNLVVEDPQALADTLTPSVVLDKVS